MIDALKEMSIATKAILVAAVIAVVALAALGISGAVSAGSGATEEEGPDITASAGESEKQMYDYLTTNKWRAADNSVEVTFAPDGTMTVDTGDGDPVERTYSLSSVELDGNTVPTGEGIAYIDGEPAVFRISKNEEGFVPTAAIDTTVFVSCAAIDANELYRVSDDSFTVMNLDPKKVSGIFSDDAQVQALANDLKAYCAAELPLVTQVRWTQQVTTDYEANSIETGFTCNDSEETELTVRIDTASHTWDISR